MEYGNLLHITPSSRLTNAPKTVQRRHVASSLCRKQALEPRLQASGICPPCTWHGRRTRRARCLRCALRHLPHSTVPSLSGALETRRVPSLLRSHHAESKVRGMLEMRPRRQSMRASFSRCPERSSLSSKRQTHDQHFQANSDLRPKVSTVGALFNSSLQCSSMLCNALQSSAMLCERLRIEARAVSVGEHAAGKDCSLTNTTRFFSTPQHQTVQELNRVIIGLHCRAA